jgi:hypothetical protein
MKMLPPQVERFLQDLYKESQPMKAVNETPLVREETYYGPTLAQKLLALPRLRKHDINDDSNRVQHALCNAGLAVWNLDTNQIKSGMRPGDAYALGLSPQQIRAMKPDELRQRVHELQQRAAEQGVIEPRNNFSMDPPKQKRIANAILTP